MHLLFLFDGIIKAIINWEVLENKKILHVTCKTWKGTQATVASPLVLLFNFLGTL